MSLAAVELIRGLETMGFDQISSADALSGSIDAIEKSRNEVSTRSGAFHRSASEGYLPVHGRISASHDPLPEADMKRVISAAELPHMDLQVRGRPREQEKGGKSLDGSPGRERSPSLKQPKVEVTEFTVNSSSPNGSDVPVEEGQQTPQQAKAAPSLKSSLSQSAGSIRRLTKRRSWILSSRSPSPSPTKAKQLKTDGVEGDGVQGSNRKKIPESITIPPLPTKDNPAASAPSSPLAANLPQNLQNAQSAQKSRRPLSALLARSLSTTSKGDREGPAPISRSSSSDRLAAPAGGSAEVPAVPATTKRERIKTSGLEGPRKKDELWSAFRSLDLDYSKFFAKPGTLKVNLVRNSLLPFLRAYAKHPSNFSLRAEDLDRRVNILNKWWMGLLEMVNGRNGQSVSGNDRPVVLEGLAGIMFRPEWRLPMSCVSVRDRSPSNSHSQSSLDSGGSDFLTESVLHNVRNMFIENLISQLGFVIDRMSPRSVPASMVTFAGKAIAYSFVYCPGVAEILVRLWAVPMPSLRRILDEADMPRNSSLRGVAIEASGGFPQHLRSLSYSSLPELNRKLQGKSLHTSRLGHIAWHGPWISRWLGRDSDLFFCFVKFFHMLAFDMIPEGATIQERLCAPCVLLVQGQLLTVIETTIRRGGCVSSPDQADGAPPITFDDVLGVDASANPLPARPNNVARSIAENRLIVLLRELLSDSGEVRDGIRKIYAETFTRLLKIGAQRVNAFDYNSCFTLCDILEESIFILVRFYRDSEDPVSFLDWDFWLEVLKRMGSSKNTMTDIRLSAFLYSSWTFLTKNESRKRQMCLNWLLTEEFAYQQFNHWCPLVRAYYMRLVCWKLLRYDGEASDLDIEIYTATSRLLDTVWCNLLFLQQNAADKGLTAPSTAPSNPIPNRRFVIIRDDSSLPTANSFLNFDNIMGMSSTQPSTYQKYASLESLKQSVEPNDQAPSTTKKRWSILRSLNPFSSNATKIDADSEDGNINHDHNSKERRPNGKISTRPETPDSRSDTPSRPHSADRSYRSFRFSLEWHDSGTAGPKGRQLYPPRLPHTLREVIPERDLESYEPLRPKGSAIVPSKYCGRALAEWSILISEYFNFYQRRMNEGVAELRSVETPVLGLESIRKPNG